MKKFIVNNWFGIAGILIGFFTSLYFYSLSEKERELSFLVDKHSISIVKKDNFEKTKSFNIVKPDGEEINSDISAFKIFLWNSGDLSIRRENILSPLFLDLKYDKNKTEILDFFIDKTTRENIIKPSLIKDSEKLKFDFNILENMDGFSINIIYTGKTTPEVSINGTIEGAKEINSDAILRDKSNNYQILSYVLGFITIIAIFYVLVSLNIKGHHLFEFSKKHRILMQLVAIISLIVGIISILFVFYTAGKNIYIESKEKADVNLYQSLPQNIK